MKAAGYVRVMINMIKHRPFEVMSSSLSAMMYRTQSGYLLKRQNNILVLLCTAPNPHADF